VLSRGVATVATGTQPQALIEQPQALIERMQILLARSEQIADPATRALVRELTEGIMDLYGEGLARIGEALHEAGSAGAELRERLLQDGIVASLLLMHDLYPVALEERVAQALDSVRPYMESHAGGVELLAIEDGVARLRLQGSCHGCASSQATLELAIREALDTHAPDLLGLEVEGVVERAAAHPAPGPCASAGAPELPMAAPAPTPQAAPEHTHSLPSAPVGASHPAPAASDSSLAFAMTPPAELLSLAARELPPEPPEHAAEGHCELCSIEVPSEHRHLLALDERRILCVCHTCLALRSGDAAYRPTGTRVLWLDELDLEEEAWSAFGIPIGLAFFLHSSAADGIVAIYPSPIGATECELALDAWEHLARANPVLCDLEPDAEALIVNRIADPPQHAIVPIDECYRLVGTIKSRWEGISGGAALETAVPEFFAELRERAAEQPRGAADRAPREAAGRPPSGAEG
jgi:Fe-S cluster biogenesis protein NfuA